MKHILRRGALYVSSKASGNAYQRQPAAAGGHWSESGSAIASQGQGFRRFRKSSISLI